MVALTVFSALILMAFSVAGNFSRSYARDTAIAGMQSKGETALRRMMDDLDDSTRVSTNSISWNSYVFNNAEVRYRVTLKYVAQTTNPLGMAVFLKTIPASYNPVFSDDFYMDLDFGWRDGRLMVPNLDDSSKLVPLQGSGLRCGGSLPAGIALDGNGRTPDGFMSFRFQPDDRWQVGLRSPPGIFDEALEGVDIDGDGKTQSRYVVGYVEQAYYVAPYVGAPESAYVLVQNSRQQVAESFILQPAQAQPSGSDPSVLPTTQLFQSNASDPARLEIHLWLLRTGQNGEPYLAHCTTVEFLRNNTSYVTAPD
jgi:hypothetical protein